MIHHPVKESLRVNLRSLAGIQVDAAHPPDPGLKQFAILQTSSLYFAYSHRPSWSGVLALALAWVVSLVLLKQIMSDQEVRTELTRQTNYIAEQLMKPFFAEREVPKGLRTPFQLYDLERDRRESAIRYQTGAHLLAVVLAMIDIASAVLLNWFGNYFSNNDFLGLHLFPPCNC